LPQRQETLRRKKNLCVEKKESLCLGASVAEPLRASGL
jgi:hypothetical protein